MACHDKTLTLSDRALAALDAAVPAAVAPASPQVKREAVCGKPLHEKAESEHAGRSTSNRQSRATKTGDTLAGVLSRFEFDYYQGVLPSQKGDGKCVVGGREEHAAMGRAVRFFESHGFRIGEPTSGGRGYGNGLPFYYASEAEAAGFIASGSNSGGMPNITVKGGRGLCADLAPKIQAQFPGIRATRIDVALDVIARDAAEFRALLMMSRQFVKARDMCAVRLEGVQTPESGRTLYIGGRKSPVMLRVYEKGRHENAKAVNAGREATADPLWLRLEFQFQNIPSHKKVAMAAMSPDQLIRAHDWPRFWLASAAKVMGLTEGIERAARFKAEYDPVIKTLETTAEAGVAQYGKVFCRLAARDIIEREFDGDASAAVIDEARLTLHAAAAFLRYLRASDKPRKVIENDRLHVEETPEARADAIAKRMQDARVEGLRRKAQRRAELARQVAGASCDSDAVKTVKVRAARVAAIHGEAREAATWA